MGMDRSEQPLTMAIRAGRRHDAARLAHGAGAAGVRDRRVPRRGVQRPVGGVPAYRRRQPVPLSADLLAEEQYVRRALPRDPGRASGKSGAHVFARNGYRAVRTTPSADTGGYESTRAGTAGPRAAPERVPGAVGGLQFSGSGAPGPFADPVHLSTASLLFSVDRQSRDLRGADRRRRAHPRRGRP